jgi:hypothetical protein
LDDRDQLAVARNRDLALLDVIGAEQRLNAPNVPANIEPGPGQLETGELGARLRAPLDSRLAGTNSPELRSHEREAANCESPLSSRESGKVVTGLAH